MPRPRRRDPDLVDVPLPDSLSATAIEPGMPKTPQVYELMRQAIVSLTFPPGTPVNERLICDRLDISRTPLREALMQLQAESLVTIVPNSGTFVSPIDLQRLFDGQLVRDALETRIIQYAARKADEPFLQALDFNMHQQRVLAERRDYDGFYRMDEAFHQMICTFGSSSRVWKIVHGAKAQLDRVRRLAIPEENHLAIVLSEHDEIAAALHARLPDLARRAMQAHIGRVFQTIRNLLVLREDHFAPGSPAIFEAFASLYERDARG